MEAGYLKKVICQFLDDSVRQLAHVLRALVIGDLYVIVSWIMIQYKIEDSGVFSCRLSRGNYLCCV